MYLVEATRSILHPQAERSQAAIIDAPHADRGKAYVMTDGRKAINA